MADIFKHFGTRGAIAFLVALIVVTWVNPLTTGGVILLLAVSMVVVFLLISLIEFLISRVRKKIL